MENCFFRYHPQSESKIGAEKFSYSNTAKSERRARLVKIEVIPIATQGKLAGQTMMALGCYAIGIDVETGKLVTADAGSVTFESADHFAVHH